MKDNLQQQKTPRQNNLQLNPSVKIENLFQNILLNPIFILKNGDSNLAAFIVSNKTDGSSSYIRQYKGTQQKVQPFFNEHTDHWMEHPIIICIINESIER